MDTTRQLYESLLRKVKEASMASALRASNIRVVDSAKPPRPYKPSFVLNSALGLLAGAFFGVVFVVVRSGRTEVYKRRGRRGYTWMYRNWG